MLVMLAVVVEALAFLVNFFIDKDNLYDHRQMVMDALNQEDLSDYAADRADPVLGWNQSGPKVSSTKKLCRCGGRVLI